MITDAVDPDFGDVDLNRGTGAYSVLSLFSIAARYLAVFWVALRTRGSSARHSPLACAWLRSPRTAAVLTSAVVAAAGLVAHLVAFRVCVWAPSARADSLISQIFAAVAALLVALSVIVMVRHSGFAWISLLARLPSLRDIFSRVCDLLLAVLPRTPADSM